MVGTQNTVQALCQFGGAQVFSLSMVLCQFRIALNGRQGLVQFVANGASYKTQTELAVVMRQLFKQAEVGLQAGAFQSFL